MSDDMPTGEKLAKSAQPAVTALPEAEITRLNDEIVTALKTVYDPEIPADVYEIGLIYRIDIADNRTVKVDMSLTSPNCPSAQELPVMVLNAVSTAPRPQARSQKAAARGSAADEASDDPGGPRKRRPRARPSLLISEQS
jgi:metal-sulfur cluster biosynthetic enzyme